MLEENLFLPLQTTDDGLERRVLQHFEQYRARVIANSNSNLEQRHFQVDDKVLLKLDFDSNPSTKRGPLTSFFTEEEYVRRVSFFIYSISKKFVTLCKN
ncbi:hypothetical protein ENBRE01_3033 [Enteropsectra breve]|nr:hypothetical protein ENBRE01_3033 [Enteropsectra breve]